MGTQIEELSERISKLEKHRNEEILTLVEILSNATFFGGMKKANCEYSKNAQCSFFSLKSDAKNKIPIVTDCRIKQCKKSPVHCHIELSDIACAFCQITNSGPIIGASKKHQNQILSKYMRF